MEHPGRPPGVAAATHPEGQAVQTPSEEEARAAATATAHGLITHFKALALAAQPLPRATKRGPAFVLSGPATGGLYSYVHRLDERLPVRAETPGPSVTRVSGPLAASTLLAWLLRTPGPVTWHDGDTRKTRAELLAHLEEDSPV